MWENLNFNLCTITFTKSCHCLIVLPVIQYDVSKTTTVRCCDLNSLQHPWPSTSKTPGDLLEVFPTWFVVHKAHLSFRSQNKSPTHNHSQSGFPLPECWHQHFSTSKWIHMNSHVYQIQPMQPDSTRLPPAERNFANLLPKAFWNTPKPYKASTQKSPNPKIIKPYHQRPNSLKSPAQSSTNPNQQKQSKPENHQGQAYNPQTQIHLDQKITEP